MSDVFFEKQSDKDCTVHSLNNSMGAVVVTKQQVLEKIDVLTKKFAETHTPEQVKKYRSQMAEGKSFFAAEIVWDTAMERGTVSAVSPVPGFGGDFADLDTLPSWVKESSLVFLGLDSKGRPHAIAARGGKIYDSQRWSDGPKQMTNANLGKAMNRIFALITVKRPGQTDLAVTRLQPAAVPVHIHSHHHREMPLSRSMAILAY